MAAWARALETRDSASRSHLRKPARHRAGARKQPPFELVEFAVRRIEHETARNADGDADDAAVELDCKTLAWQFSSPDEQARGR